MRQYCTLVSADNASLVRATFDAFLRADWTVLSEAMDPQVQWLWHEPCDWDGHDREQVLATLSSTSARASSPD